MYPVSVYLIALPNKFITILLQDPIGNEKTQSSLKAISRMINRALRCGNGIAYSSVGDEGASTSFEVTGIYEDPEKTASTTSSVAMVRSNAGSFLRRFFNGFEDSRIVFAFFSLLEDTLFLASLILA